MSEITDCLIHLQEQVLRLGVLVAAKVDNLSNVVETMDEDLFRQLLILGRAAHDQKLFYQLNSASYNSWSEEQKKTYGDIRSRHETACEKLGEIAMAYAIREDIKP